MDTSPEILHALRVKGLAGPEVLAALTGLAADDVPAATQPLIDGALVRHLPGPRGGYLLTPDGKAAAAQALADDEATVAARPALAEFDTQFLPLNTGFKQICQRWQVRADGTANDHTDADYDQEVVAELAAFHDEFEPVIEPVARELPRFGRYVPRLTAALARIQDGDRGSFARPMADSYHDIWMELHNDVVLSLGRDRTAADESAN